MRPVDGVVADASRHVGEPGRGMGSGRRRSPHSADMQRRCRILCIRSTPAQSIGNVEAPDADAAIKEEAIKTHGIADPEKQKRLVAHQTK
jgi:hypothetical protein